MLFLTASHPGINWTLLISVAGLLLSLYVVIDRFWISKRAPQVSFPMTWNMGTSAYIKIHVYNPSSQNLAITNMQLSWVNDLKQSQTIDAEAQSMRLTSSERLQSFTDGLPINVSPFTAANILIQFVHHEFKDNQQNSWRAQHTLTIFNGQRYFQFPIDLASVEKGSDQLTIEGYSHR